ncbi:hypothetical protein, partial [Deinococcus roseus]|uniref:hypothetical protein n=1 Tax=Deinococcus roseus TaxID=392414 RepID=UPI00166BBA83
TRLARPPQIALLARSTRPFLDFCPVQSSALTLISCSKTNVSSPASTFDYQVQVALEKTHAPVQGALVFDNATNTLLSSTNEQGVAHLKAKDGQVLRVVEPKYGQQQALVTVSKIQKQDTLVWKISWNGGM